MTLNINHHGAKYGAWSVRRELIRRAIEQVEADVVALQAVQKNPAGDTPDQATQLATLLPGIAQAVFEPAMRLPNGVLQGSGFLSKLPATLAQKIELTLQPGLDDVQRRVLLHAVVDLPTGPLHVWNAHFSWVPAQANDNVQEALAALAGVPERTIFAGDMNGQPNSEPMRRMADAGWVDAWKRLRPDDPGYTFETDEPSARLDYLWVSPDLVPSLRKIDLVQTAQDESGNALSDHLGVVLQLAVDLEA
ncbi:MAG: endonuclease/exonuclease/phosphatase family protein [Candidatus Eisenbacteria bacterium]